jgi:hypothetical protein
MILIRTNAGTHQDALGLCLDWTEDECMKEAAYEKQHSSSSRSQGSDQH